MTGQALTGYTAGTGTVVATDTILEAIGKLGGVTPLTVTTSIVDQTIVGLTSGTTIAVNTMRYTRIGNLVTLQVSVSQSINPSFGLLSVKLATASMAAPSTHTTATVNADGLVETINLSFVNVATGFVGSKLDGSDYMLDGINNFELSYTVSFYATAL